MFQNFIRNNICIYTISSKNTTCKIKANSSSATCIPKLTKTDRQWFVDVFLGVKFWHAIVFAGLSPRTCCLVAMAINCGLFVCCRIGWFEHLSILYGNMMNPKHERAFCMFGNLADIPVHDYSTCSIFQNLIFKPSSIRQVVPGIQIIAFFVSVCEIITFFPLVFTFANKFSGFVDFSKR